MKIKNKNTNNVFDLPKEQVEKLIAENPDIYEKFIKKSSSSKIIKNNAEVKPCFKQNTILPLIWEG